MYKPQIGTVIHGTVQNRDLLPAFADELAAIIPGVEHPGNKQTYQELVDEAAAIDPESHDALDLIIELMDALTECAPENCYFGAHEGDGSDFGFWPIDES